MNSHNIHDSLDGLNLPSSPDHSPKKNLKLIPLSDSSSIISNRTPIIRESEMGVFDPLLIKIFDKQNPSNNADELTDLMSRPHEATFSSGTVRSLSAIDALQNKSSTSSVLGGPLFRSSNHNINSTKHKSSLISQPLESTSINKLNLPSTIAPPQQSSGTKPRVVSTGTIDSLPGSPRGILPIQVPSVVSPTQVRNDKELPTQISSKLDSLSLSKQDNTPSQFHSIFRLLDPARDAESLANDPLFLTYSKGERDADVLTPLNSSAVSKNNNRISTFSSVPSITSNAYYDSKDIPRASPVAQEQKQDTNKIATNETAVENPITEDANERISIPSQIKQVLRLVDPTRKPESLANDDLFPFVEHLPINDSCRISSVATSALSFSSQQPTQIQQEQQKTQNQTADLHDPWNSLTAMREMKRQGITSKVVPFAESKEDNASYTLAQRKDTNLNDLKKGLENIEADLMNFQATNAYKSKNYFDKNQDSNQKQLLSKNFSHFKNNLLVSPPAVNFEKSENHTKTEPSIMDESSPFIHHQTTTSTPNNEHSHVISVDNSVTKKNLLQNVNSSDYLPSFTTVITSSKVDSISSTNKHNPTVEKEENTLHSLTTIPLVASQAEIPVSSSNSQVTIQSSYEASKTNGQSFSDEKPLQQLPIELPPSPSVANEQNSSDSLINQPANPSVANSPPRCLSSARISPKLETSTSALISEVSPTRQSELAQTSKLHVHDDNLYALLSGSKPNSPSFSSCIEPPKASLLSANAESDGHQKLTANNSAKFEEVILPSNVNPNKLEANSKDDDILNEVKKIIEDKKCITAISESSYSPPLPFSLSLRSTPSSTQPRNINHFSPEKKSYKAEISSVNSEKQGIGIRPHPEHSSNFKSEDNQTTRADAVSTSHHPSPGILNSQHDVPLAAKVNQQPSPSLLAEGMIIMHKSQLEDLVRQVTQDVLAKHHLPPSTSISSNNMEGSSHTPPLEELSSPKRTPSSSNPPRVAVSSEADDETKRILPRRSTAMTPPASTFGSGRKNLQLKDEVMKEETSRLSDENFTQKAFANSQLPPTSSQSIRVKNETGLPLIEAKVDSSLSQELMNEYHQLIRTKRGKENNSNNNSTNKQRHREEGSKKKALPLIELEVKTQHRSPKALIETILLSTSNNISPISTFKTNTNNNINTRMMHNNNNNNNSQDSIVLRDALNTNDKDPKYAIKSASSFSQSGSSHLITPVARSAWIARHLRLITASCHSRGLSVLDIFVPSKQGFETKHQLYSQCMLRSYVVDVLFGLRCGIAPDALRTLLSVLEEEEEKESGNPVDYDVLQTFDARILIKHLLQSSRLKALEETPPSSNRDYDSSTYWQHEKNKNQSNKSASTHFVVYNDNTNRNHLNSDAVPSDIFDSKYSHHYQNEHVSFQPSKRFAQHDHANHHYHHRKTLAAVSPPSSGSTVPDVFRRIATILRSRNWSVRDFVSTLVAASPQQVSRACEVVSRQVFTSALRAMKLGVSSLVMDRAVQSLLCTDEDLVGESNTEVILVSDLIRAIRLGRVEM